MAKVKSSKTVSDAFEISPDLLTKEGVLNATLAIDTKLFIDPLLFEKSSHVEMNTQGVTLYKSHFEKVIRLLQKTSSKEDVAWRTARRLLTFHEIKGTCLGYGAASITGSGFGTALTEQILQVGKEIVDLGVTDPDLFQVMALFEERIGPDRISDMATNVVFQALNEFNRRVLGDLNLQGNPYTIDGIKCLFLTNPCQGNNTPLILVPRDVLRSLPIARDWGSIADAARHNEMIRKRVNEHIAHIWERSTRQEKKKLREQALSSPEAFQTLVDAIHAVPRQPYPVDRDPDALVRWAQVAAEFTRRFPLNLKRAEPIRDLDEAADVVKSIISRFRQLIEQNGLNKELYENKKPRHEDTAQRLFFAVADCYCEANNLDLSPEVDSGNGQVDFKISKGFFARVLVEVKLSTNSKLVSGYNKQLEAYKKAEQSLRATYLVLDVGRLGNKYKALLRAYNEAGTRGDPVSDVELIDGIIKPSASHR